MNPLIKYDGLTEGYEYPVSNFSFDSEDVTVYLQAVKDTGFLNLNPELVPPLAVAARAISELSGGTVSPPGTVHSSQEFAFNRTVFVGERLKLIARVEKRLDRGELHLLTTGFHILDSKEERVLSGKITVACRGVEARWLHTGGKII